MVIISKLLHEVIKFFHNILQVKTLKCHVQKARVLFISFFLLNVQLVSKEQTFGHVKRTEAIFRLANIALQ